MPDFQYTAREASGRQVTGVLDAPTETDVVRALGAKRLFPIRIEPTKKTKVHQRSMGRRVGGRHLVTFFVQLADLLRAGVPLLRCLELLEKKATQVSLRVVIADIRSQVADGSRLAEAMRRHPRVFGELSISMVRAGEEGGFLEDVLDRISAFTEHQQDLKSQVVGALIYPAFLLFAGTGIVTLLLAFFVPMFEPIFDDMASRGSLPWATTTLLWMSETVQQRGLILVAVIGVVAFAAHRWLQTAGGRRTIDAAQLKTPLVGPLVRSLAIARICRILGTLLRNDVPILRSLQIAQDAAGNVLLKEAVASAAESVSTGRELAKPLEASGQFPEEVVEMIAVGAEANNLEEVLITIADTMEKHSRRRLDIMVRLLEPVLLTIMAGLVLYVVAALGLPMFQSAGLV